MKVVLVLVGVCVANAMRINPMYGQYQDDSPDSGQFSPVYKNAVCFGLARKTRTQTVGVPYLYNTRTGQTAPMPGNLRHLDPAIVSKMDRDGWEVRTRAMTFARPIYFRVRVCCPWDAECRRRTTGPVEQQRQGVCENGGQVEVKAGVKVCVCPRGFRGAACQYPDLIYRAQVTQAYRGMPRQAPTPRHFTDMIRQTELWRQKMMTSQGRLSPSVSPPILSQKQHVILNSMSGPWSPRAAAWQQQTMKAKMAELCRRRRLMALRNKRLQAEMLLAMQLRGGSPYAVRQLNDMQDMPVSPYPYSKRMMQQQAARMAGPVYSTEPRRSMVNPQSSGNPYSRVRPYVEPPQFGRPVNRAILSPEARTPWDMDPFSQNPTMMSDPRSIVHPLQYLKSVLRPEARTPWDMDPFQKNPALMRDPRAQAALEREKQLVALAYYRYMRSQSGNDVTTRPSLGGVTYPGPAPSPPVNGMDLSAQLPPMSQATPNNDVLDNQGQMETDLDLSIGDESEKTSQNSPNEAPLGPAEAPLDPTEGPLGPAEVDTEGPLGPAEVDTEGPLGPAEKIDTEQPLGPSEESLIPTEGPLGPPEAPLEPTEGPLGPSEQPLRPMEMSPTSLPLGPAGSDMTQHMPSPVEMAKMEACRSQLEPEMDQCLTEYRLTFAQFMNPDYMALAKDVCVHSAVVGPCITSKDSVCGQGSQILLTRKMIQSVMQMMGMVCQQIMARGDAPLPPLPSVSTNEIPPFKQPLATHQPAPPVKSMSSVSTHGPEVSGDAVQFTNQPEATAEPTNQMPDGEPSTQDTEIPALPPTEKPNHKKFDATKSGLKSKPTASPTVHSAELTQTESQATARHDTSHDAAHPVAQQAMLLLGYPAWLVIALGGLLLLVFLLAGFICCLCVRRRSKKSVELEVVPAPLDEKKLAIIGVPPPLYFTTPVNQTQEVDDLSLPPLELAGEDSEDGEDVKVNLEEDADDESDEKQEDEEKKEKRKTKKDQQ